MTDGRSYCIMNDLEAEIARCDREIERCRAACAVDKHAAIGECDWRVERNILLEQTEASKERMESYEHC